MIAFIAAALAAPSCGTTTSPDALRDVINAAEAAYIALDEDAFLDSTDRVLIRTPCLDALASPDLAARLHRLVAVRRWGEAPSSARQSLLAANRAAPELRVADLVGDAHPLAMNASGDATKTAKLSKPKGSQLWLDGNLSHTRATDQPVIAQLIPAVGPPTWTVLLGPDDPLPPFAAIPKARGPLRWAASGAAVGSAAAYGVAWSQAQRFDDPLDAEALRGVQQSTNGALVASGTLATGAVSALVASFLVR